MSNQIYLNPYQKFGVNNVIAYTLSANQTITVAAGQTTVLFDIGYNGQDMPSLIQLDPAGVFTILSDGMYAIQPMFTVRSSIAAHTLAYSTAIVITRSYDLGNPISVGEISDRYMASASSERNFDTKFTGYLGRGDRFTIEYINTNHETPRDVSIRAGTTVLWITKVY